MKIVLFYVVVISTYNLLNIRIRIEKSNRVKLFVPKMLKRSPDIANIVGNFLFKHNAHILKIILNHFF